MLSRILIRALGCLLALPLTAVSAAWFEVDAAANSSSGGEGLNTGIYLAAGQEFVVSVDPDDIWTAGGPARWSNADGLDRELRATGFDASGRPAGTTIGARYRQWTQHGLSAPRGALVGRIGDRYFVIGTRYRGRAPRAGELRLFYWDEDPRDNHGRVRVEVRTP